MEEEIFKRCEIEEEKLISYGFVKKGKSLEYKINIIENFEIIINVTNKKIKGKIIDNSFNDEYTSFRIDSYQGEFVNNVREKFKEVLLDIKDKCTKSKYFIYPQSNRITNKIKEKYNDNPEFLWEDNSSGVFRNKNNKKWYGIIMNINKNKLIDEDKDIEVLNLKLDPKKIEQLLNKKGYYKCYHMNKKYWITIILDDELEDNEIMNLVEESYKYTVETNEWVIPTNPKYWDIINCFNNTDTIDWKQNKGIKKNDTVYIYVGAPYSCIMYKCIAEDTDLESPYKEFTSIMKLKLIKKYPQDKYQFNILKEYDLKAVRGARRMPQKLIDKIKKDEGE